MVGGTFTHSHQIVGDTSKCPYGFPVYLQAIGHAKLERRREQFLPPLFELKFWGHDLPRVCSAAATLSQITLRKSLPSEDVLIEEIVGVARSII